MAADTVENRSVESKPQWAKRWTEYSNRSRPKKARQAAEVKPAHLGYMIHCSPQTAKKGASVVFYPHGIEVQSVVKKVEREAWDRAPAGPVTELSPSARRRMIWATKTIDFEEFPYKAFATLTYHDNWQGRDHKKDLDSYLKRIRRIYPDIQYLWRLELQDRGAPHFHHLFLSPTTPIDCDLLAAHWHTLVDPGNIHHKKHGAEVAALDSGWLGVSMYLTKYSTKPEDREGAVYEGRRWGRSKGLKSNHVTGEYPLSNKEEVRLRRFLRGLLKARRNRSSLYAKTIVRGHTSKVFMDSGTYETLRYIATLKCPVFAMPPPLLQVESVKEGCAVGPIYDGGRTLELASNVL